MPQVTVIIPSYNRAVYLSEAIDSVLSQTFKDFEIVIIDDGSTDNTREIIKKYIGKIKYFYKSNGGEASARNFGVNKAQNKYMAFLDSDDVWLPELLENELRYLENNDFDIVYSKMVLKDLDNNILGYKPSREQENNFDWFMKHMGHMPASTILVKNECFKKVGYFDESLKVLPDYDMWLRISRYFKVGFLNEVLSIYRKHDSNVTNKLHLFHEAEIQISKKYLEDDEINIKYRRVLIDRIVKNYYALGKYHYINKRYIRSVHFAIQALKCNLLLGKLFWEHDDSLPRKIHKLINPYGLVFINLVLECTTLKKVKLNNGVNILYYEPTSGYGGSSGCLLGWLLNLNREKFNPIILSHYNGPAIKKIKGLDVKTIKIPLRPISDEANSRILSYMLLFTNLVFFVLPMSFIIYLKIKKYRIDIIHLNTKLLTVIPGIIAAKLSGIPSVCHMHDIQKLTKREKFFGNMVDDFIGLTPSAVELYKKELPNKKIELISNGIDLDTYDYQKRNVNFRNGFNIRPSDRVVGIVGRFVKGKGFSDFIYAARVICNKTTGTKLMIVGSAPRNNQKYEIHLKKLVKDLDLENNVIFTGWREDIKEIMSSFDVLVQASSTFPEGFGLTCIEAMALEKPVVATDVPGPSEVVLDGITGLIVPPASPEALAEAILKLLNNPEMAKSFGKAGRKRVEEYFDIKKITKQIESLYSEVLNRGN